MKKMIIAAVAAGLLVTGARAQEAGGAAVAPEDPNAPSVAVEGGAPVELTGETEKSAVQIVLLSALPEDADSLELAEDADEVANLQASIADNAAVKAALVAGGYAISDVAAMATNVDGSIVVYIDDRP